MDTLQAEVLVVGGSTGGTSAAIQAARRGAKTILVSEFPWLGGMLTAAGVCAPDGNELEGFQTGLWGAFLQELHQRQPGGLHHAWVSFFTYDPRVGAEIFADWVRSLPNLHWISGQVPLAVHQQGDRITGVRFPDYDITAEIVLDGTELGDLLALAEIPHRWGWDWQPDWAEPSAPKEPNQLTQRYPIQAPTWVVMLQDFGEEVAPLIPPSPRADLTCFEGAWAGYDAVQFLDYGRLPGDRFMINWPQQGNDYGEQLDRLVHSPQARQTFEQEARWYAQDFACFIQAQLGRRYGLAPSIFPEATFPEASPDLPRGLGGGAYALHPYYRESRRLQGVVTLCEQDILPQAQGRVASLPLNSQGQVEAIALGNYVNDHHYPGLEWPFQAKALRWGGRWTGTPFTLPYSCLIPVHTDGVLVCEKNISVSHIANGATRLQPVVLGIGQAAGMAAALCVQQGCQPRDLSIRTLQDALLCDPWAPATLIPLFNLPPAHPEWRHWQRYYLDHPENYPLEGDAPVRSTHSPPSGSGQPFSGEFERQAAQTYSFRLVEPTSLSGQTVQLVTLRPQVNELLQACASGQQLLIEGVLNVAGNWLLAESVVSKKYGSQTVGDVPG